MQFLVQCHDASSSAAEGSGIVRSGRHLHRAPKVRTVLTMALGREISGEVPGWVRLGLGVVLAIPQLTIGFWAVIAPPRTGIRDLPGLDPRLIAADPPFNERLATDTGAGFLTTGVALVLAALLGRRSGALVALAGYCSPSRFPTPCSTRPIWSPGLDGSEDVFNARAPVGEHQIAVLFTWGTWPRRSAAAGALEVALTR